MDPRRPTLLALIRARKAVTENGFVVPRPSLVLRTGGQFDEEAVPLERGDGQTDKVVPSWTWLATDQELDNDSRTARILALGASESSHMGTQGRLLEPHSATDRCTRRRTAAGRFAKHFLSKQKFQREAICSLRTCPPASCRWTFAPFRDRGFRMDGIRLVVSVVRSEHEPGRPWELEYYTPKRGIAEDGTNEECYPMRWSLHGDACNPRFTTQFLVGGQPMSVKV